jgi:hypothetical protein
MARTFTRLDRTAIRKLKPGERLSEHGIIVVRLADGDLHFAINVMVNGRRIHRAIGKESEGVTRTRCEEIVEKERTAARADRFGLPRPESRKAAAPTFAKAASDYLARMAETAGRNIRWKRTISGST